MDYYGKTESFDAPSSSAGDKNKINWLFVDLNSYFASVEQQIKPDLRGKPIGVVPMMAETTCCLAASYQAKKFGVKTGTLIADARKMCPGIIFVIADHRKYVEYHERIVEAVESCLPVSKIMSIDEMACRLTGRDQNYKNAVELATEVKNSILRVGEVLTSSVGIAPNRFLAKVASDMQKPDGLTILKPEDLPNALYKLKPRDFPGIGAKMEQRLIEQKITTVEQLYAMDLHQMRALWNGVLGERFYYWMRGEDLEYQFEVGKSIGHSHVLAPDFRNQHGAYAIAVKMLHKAAFRLREGRLMARRISFSIVYQNYMHWGDYLKINASQDTHSLGEAFRIMWQKRAPGTPLKVSITLSDFVQEEQRTLSFFDDPKKEQASRAMDLINKKYGKYLLYLADMHETREQVKDKIAFSSVPKYDVD